MIQHLVAPCFSVFEAVELVEACGGYKAGTIVYITLLHQNGETAAVASKEGNKFGPLVTVNLSQLKQLP